MSSVKVSVMNFPSMFKLGSTVVIPDYQRPYVWGKEKSEELLIDLDEYFLKENKTSNYYLGSILLWRNTKDKTFEIIDGQQRITTILLMKYCIEETLDVKHNIKFNSHLSFRKIRETASYFESQISTIKKLDSIDFLNKVEFTVIFTTSEDESFTFFDTQNTRGVKLSATDFLKAYHLRAIESPQLQEIGAKTWERAQSINKDGTFMEQLFEKMLWRARNWRGKNCRLLFDTDKQIRPSFQKKTFKFQEEDCYPIFQNRLNKGIEKTIWGENGKPINYFLSTREEDSKNLPFHIRQPIYKGIHFFKYTEKYCAIYLLLFKSDTVNLEINNLKDFYNKVYTPDMSEYLRDFMQLCLITYYDSFGSDRIFEAVLYFDYAIGSMRIQLQQIKREASKNFLNDNDYNLLDLITSAFLPDEVFSFINSIDKIHSIYQNEDLEDNVGVQGRYKTRIKRYFGKSQFELTLSNRKEWNYGKTKLVSIDKIIRRGLI
ncbi:MAG: DUF262 domain-containing protein [Bacteroidetes bacterium]|nr:DUF262 domain-containing protein [Bacteroidota bacterium]